MWPTAMTGLARASWRRVSLPPTARQWRLLAQPARFALRPDQGAGARCRESEQVVRRYRGRGLLKAMRSLHPSGLANELAITRRITPRLQLTGITFPCIIVHRECLPETFGEVLAGIFRHYKELEEGEGVEEEDGREWMRRRLRERSRKKEERERHEVG